MIDAVIERIQALDHDREHRALTVHVGVTSPIALERIAYERLTSVGHEARHIAGVQLRVVHDLAHELRCLEQLSEAPRLEQGVRAAIAGLLRNLCAESDMLPVVSSPATMLLEPALLFHALLSRLRPWIPSIPFAFEPDLVVEMLQLGIPDYLHPLLRQRFEALWQVFHQLRQPPTSEPQVLPPAPLWMSPRWVAAESRATTLKPSKLTG